MHCRDGCVFGEQHLVWSDFTIRRRRRQIRKMRRGRSSTICKTAGCARTFRVIEENLVLSLVRTVMHCSIDRRDKGNVGFLVLRHIPFELVLKANGRVLVYIFFTSKWDYWALPAEILRPQGR